MCGLYSLTVAARLNSNRPLMGTPGRVLPPPPIIPPMIWSSTAQPLSSATPTVSKLIASALFFIVPPLLGVP